MKVEKLMRRLKIEFVKVNILQACLDSIMLFLGANLFVYIFNLNIAGPYSNFQILAGITAVFFIMNLAFRVRKYNVELYEEKNPELNEMLRTARDNIDRKNIASQALFDEIVEKARKMSSDSIIPAKSIMQKVLVIGVLSFVTIFSGLAGFQIEGSEAAIFDGIEMSGEDEEPTEPDIRNGSEILGEPTEIDIEERELEFEIEGAGEASDQQFTFTTGEEDFASESAREGIEEDRELAQRYSDSLRELEASE